MLLGAPMIKKISSIYWSVFGKIILYIVVFITMKSPRIIMSLN